MPQYEDATEVGCLAIIQSRDGSHAVVATLHQNPPAELTAYVLQAVAAISPGGSWVNAYELAVCEHCAKGPRNLDLRPVEIVPDDGNAN